MSEVAYLLDIARHKTNHILHLLLTLFTGGIWFFFWVFTDAMNCVERNKVNRAYNKPEEDNYAAWSLVLIILIIAMIMI